MRVSVVICTRHRRMALDRALRALLACARAFDDGDWEVLVVDNGDSGSSGPIDLHHFDALPVRIVPEPRPGLSHARNRGVVASRGEWLIWTDDDVTVGPDWLRAYQRAVDAAGDIAVLGGPIRPAFEGRPPDWLTDGQEHVSSAFARRDPGDVDDTFGRDGPLPYGANFAIRRADALRFPFDPELGRQPSHPTRGWEEAFVIERILGADRRGRWLPDAQVTHHIDSGRQTAAFIRAYYGDIGYIDTLCKAHRFPRHRIVRQLVRAISAGLRSELSLALLELKVTRRPRALLLRSAGHCWGDARAWATALLNPGAASSWREKCRE